MRPTRSLLLLCSAIAVAAMAACSAQPGQTSTPQNEPEPGWSVVSNTIRAAFATPDLAPGNRRIAFALSDDHGLIRFPLVLTESYFYPGGFDGDRTGPIEQSASRFFEFPMGLRGIHTAYVLFDQPGTWSVEASIPRSDGSIEKVEIRFAVAGETHSVDIGQVPPRSSTRTIEDVTSLDQLTTGSLHDPALYQLSLREAIESGRPSVVAFASPAFCTNAICGPQDEVLSELHTMYGDRVNFIHIDLYENPDEIQGDLSRGIESAVLMEWGLISQEWTFVLNSEGRIVARFENFAPKEELAPEIENVLASS